MNNKANRNKLEELCDFVIEVSRGNFTLQLSPKDSGDLEPLIKLHNMMNEELNSLVHNIHGNKSYPVIKSFTLKITSNLHINFISPGLVKELGFNKAPNNLSNLVASKSLNKLKKLLKETDFNKCRERKLKLEFKNKDGLILKVTANLLIIDSQQTTLILINIYWITYQNSFVDDQQQGVQPRSHKYPTRNRSILLQENRELIENLQSYLLKNLDQPFPGIKDLAGKFNASESKLKKGFKYYNGVSIYKFVQEKRLEKAHLLLTETEKPVSTIAQECGFVSAAHFSRTFKKKFGYRPTDVQRNPE